MDHFSSPRGVGLFLSSALLLAVACSDDEDDAGMIILPGGGSNGGSNNAGSDNGGSSGGSNNAGSHNGGSNNAGSDDGGSNNNAGSDGGGPDHGGAGVAGDDAGTDAGDAEVPADDGGDAATGGGDGAVEALYQLVVLDPNQLTHIPTSINNHGQITSSARNEEDARAAWFWDGEQGHFINGERSDGPGNASDVNDDGQVVGSAHFLRDYPDMQGSFQFRSRPFLYQDGTATDLPVLGGNSMGRAEGINAAGDIVGTTYGGPGQQHAFLYADGSMIDIGGGQALAVNRHRQVVGYLTDPVEVPHAFLFQFTDGGAPAQDLGTLGGESSRAYAINDEGEIVGHAQRATGLFSAFLYRDGAMAELPAPGVESNALGINSHGHIVGNFSTADFADLVFGYLYRDGQMIVLGEAIENSHCWSSIQVADINDRGDIVGLATTAADPPSECTDPPHPLVVLTQYPQDYQ